MNNTNQLKKRWLVIVAALIMLAFSLKEFDFSQVESLSVQDVLPVILLTALIFLFRTSLLSVMLLVIQKAWKRLSKKE